MTNEKKHFKINSKMIPLLILWALLALINVLSWQSVSFADFIRLHIFPVLSEAMGHVSNLFSFSIGEWMLVLAVVLLVILLADVVYLLICKLSKKGKHQTAGRAYALVCLWIATVVAFIMTINCFNNYHTTGFREYYIQTSGRTYTVQELAAVRAAVIQKANELAEEMPRTEDGQLEVRDTRQDAIDAMQHLGETYPLLSGYYTTPKRLFFSGFFSQQYMSGYYFPFSGEANYNGIMYASNTAATQCHELAHTKGFIYEDEANFIGYLACLKSGDPYLMYSGLLSVLSYLNTDLYYSLGGDIMLYSMYSQPSEKVVKDRVFLTEEVWEEVEEKAVLDTETVQKASDAFVEANLKLNGIQEGSASYGLVVRRLLEYYDSLGAFVYNEE